MTIRIARLIPTSIEIAKGRFMRAPEHPDGDEGLDNGDDAEEDDDQSGSSGGATGDDESDTDASDADDDEESEPKPKGRNGYEKRIAKLTRRAKEAEAERDRLRSEKGGDPKKEAAKPTGDGKPKLDDFDTYEDFIEALAEFKADQRINASRAVSEKEKAEGDFLSRLKTGRKAFKDWDDVVTDDVKISTAMQSAIRDSDIPADILYYLGDNPDEAERILNLPAGKAALAIGKIEAKLEGKKAKSESGGNERRQSEAPEPIKPTAGSGKKLSKDYEDMSYGDFVKARQRETRSVAPNRKFY